MSLLKSQQISAEEIRHMVEVDGLSQAEVARRLDVSPAFIALMLNNHIVRRWSYDDYAEIQARLNNGSTVAELAKEFGVTTGRMYQIMKKGNVVLPKKTSGCRRKQIIIPIEHGTGLEEVAPEVPPVGEIDHADRISEGDRAFIESVSEPFKPCTKFEDGNEDGDKDQDFNTANAWLKKLNIEYFSGKCQNYIVDFDEGLVFLGQVYQKTLIGTRSDLLDIARELMAIEQLFVQKEAKKNAED